MALSNRRVRVELARKLADYLRARVVADDVEITRRPIPEPPNPRRMTVLPGTGAATATDVFLGNGGRATRDEEFTVLVSIEAVGGDDQDALEDSVSELVEVVEDTAAEVPNLGDLDGITMFGVTVQTTDHPVIELAAGVLYQWVEVEVSARGRYD